MSGQVATEVDNRFANLSKRNRCQLGNLPALLETPVLKCRVVMNGFDETDGAADGFVDSRFVKLGFFGPVRAQSGPFVCILAVLILSVHKSLS